MPDGDLFAGISAGQATMVTDHIEEFDEDGIRDAQESRGLGDVYKRQVLQRSPTYFYAGPNMNELADMLRMLDLPEEWVHEIVRRKILLDSHALIELSLEEPQLVKDELIKMVADMLPEGYDVETHFTPT